jgi:hypothetical protein
MASPECTNEAFKNSHNIIGPRCQSHHHSIVADWISLMKQAWCGLTVGLREIYSIEVREKSRVN